MNRRTYLKKSILLCGDSDGAVFKRVFHIVRRIDAGASVVCYEAYHDQSGRGVLKEFYPVNAYGMERRRDGQLIHPDEFGDAKEKFLSAKRAYLEPYELLLDAKQSGNNPDLATFIPPFEIYRGCDLDGDDAGTAYIWAPEPELETFDHICREIHRNPAKNPEQQLVTVLTAVESLARCICSLHCADLIHRDIKPSNFGFLKRGGETLTQTLSLFDINTVCSVFSCGREAVGTDGYMEPEAGYVPANNQTDLYSIGATLFHAIIVTDEVKGGGYLFKADYYDRIREMVDGSRLIKASESNSHPRLRNVLVRILQKCLCERTGRYENCEELMEDLQTALYYALPAGFSKKNLSGEKWVLADVEKSLDLNRNKNSFLAIQYHLYERPLYLCSREDEDRINVLIIGFGNYGQKFLDACLQNGQIRNKKLCVTVISDDLVDRDIYLSERPELQDFFRIDDSGADKSDSYGDLSFDIRQLNRDDTTMIGETMQRLICDHFESDRPHYIFVALGDDDLNRAAALECGAALEAVGGDCPVSYVCENDPQDHVPAFSLCPVHVNADMKKSRLHADIERMAFNTHLIWEKNLNLDYRLVRSGFKKNYNHDSCVSNVLGLKYKLFSIGIDLETVGFQEAARRFSSLMADKKNKALKDELVWIEHRRWVTEKLCLGWRRIKNLEECAGGITRDERSRKHVCIVRSRPDQRLSGWFIPGKGHEKWDTAPGEEMDLLDELDRMSVELHRMYSEKAGMARKQNLLTGSMITGIRALIEGNKKATIAFQEWYSCLKDIWSGDTGKVRLYRSLKNAFLAAADSLPSDRGKALRDQVNAFEALFYPVMASMEYRDWKQDDVALIDNIPFILTYTGNAYLAIPFVCGSNSEEFDNVAAATVVSPARILYLYFVEKRRDLQNLLDSLPGMTAYMKKKNMKASVEFIITCPRSLESMLKNEGAGQIMRIGNGRIRQVKVLVLNGIETDAQAFTAYLEHRASGRQFFAVEKNASALSARLQGAGFYDSFASYQFDSASMKFHSLHDCDMLRCIRKAPYITVNDMVTFCRSSSQSSRQPEYFDDYRSLWKRYDSDSSTWKYLCDLLGEHSRKNDLLVSFGKKLPGEKGQNVERYHYILPFVCIRSVSKIIQFLKEYEILEEGSYVKGYTTDSCEVMIADRCGFRNRYDKLFSNVYALMLPDAISLHLNPKSHVVNVTFDNLTVRDVQVPGARAAGVRDLMDFFSEKRYVIDLTYDSGQSMHFTFATRQIKELMTTAGKILEVYTYHKARELGAFDDVVSSFEIDWEGTGVMSELDCILTKGFRTLFVECKARPELEQEYYFRLAGLAERFGINATAVLIADTREKSFYDHTPLNVMQRKRGSMMNVITVWRPDEINNIGHTLLKIINGKYENKED